MNINTPAEVFPPGEFIREEIKARGWTQEDLAQIMGRPQTAINLMINDKRGITPESAKELAGAFGTSPEFWINLDSAYRLSKAKVPVADIAKRAALYSSVPVKEMEKRGWIKKTITDTDRMDWLERNLMSLHHDQATCSVDMSGVKVRGQLVNEARGNGGGPGYFTVKHRTIRDAVDAAMNWKKE